VAQLRLDDVRDRFDRQLDSPAELAAPSPRRGRHLDTAGYAAYMFNVIERASHVLGVAADAEDATHDENGVDLTLIRVYLDMTPIERVRSLQNAVRAIGRFRPIKSQSRE
jgi:hypothetical protein